MPSLEQHIKIGAVAGGVVGALYSTSKQFSDLKMNPALKFDIWKLVGSTLLGAGLGAIAGALPDLVEPATNPHHRQFFHSIAMIGVVGCGAAAVEKSKMDKEMRQLVYCTFVGYVSHLVADSETAMGIDLV